MKKQLAILSSAWLVTTAFAQDQTVYPFRPLPTDEIVTRVEKLTEDQGHIRSIYILDSMGLNYRNARQQPWSGSYWPLNQGMIGNTYHEKKLWKVRRMTSWQTNVRKFKKRQQRELSDPYSLSERELSKMAPSEKYDLLLGDTNFDLTNRIWNFVEKWGNEKKWGFLTSINLPEGYRVPEGNRLMALWEGICHGWTTAAGNVPRPERTVEVKLPNGKMLPFYPNDIKALVSLLWANSMVQDNVIVEGLRCNLKYPTKDKFGRYIDKPAKDGTGTLLPACADVHPAVLHLTMTNVLGIQGRSFVVDKSAVSSVSNQPVAGYELKYFNPETGNYGTLHESILSVKNYINDPFADARNIETKSIVGVRMTLKYSDWEFPKKAETNYEHDDKIVDKEFNYDLELDAQGNIIGGQWRVFKNGNINPLRLGSTHQPDFIWVVPRNWKDYFKPITGLDSWDLRSGVKAPESWRAAAKSAHSFTYNVGGNYGYSTCKVIPTEPGKKVLEVPCEFKYPKPQPLQQVVDRLIELSK
jgi:hypothetical protein